MGGRNSIGIRVTRVRLSNEQCVLGRIIGKKAIR